jgi:excinuclease UvrABC nuclease subunit
MYIGPFRSREFADKAQRLLARLFNLRTCNGNLTPDPAISPCLVGQVGACSAPCTSRISLEAYREHVTAFVQFLNGENSQLQQSLIEKRDVFAEELRFESAARLQQDIQLLDQIQLVHQRFHWIVTRAHAFLLLPSHESGAAQGYLILNGRLISSGLVRTREDLESFTAVCHERFAVDQDRPLRPEEIDSSVILAAWLRDPDRSQGVVFPIDSPSALMDRLEEIEFALEDIQRVEPFSSSSF